METTKYAPFKGRRIWIIQAQENPEDASILEGRSPRWRSNKLALDLAVRGADVTRIRSSFSHNSKEQLASYTKAAGPYISLPNRHFDTVLLGARPYRHHIGFRRVMSHQDLAKNFQLWAADNDSPDAIHVGNVPEGLALVATEYGVKNNIPVIIDVRDLWPETVVSVLGLNERSWLGLGMTRVLTKVFDKGAKSLALATAISALTEPFLEWGLHKATRQRIHLDRVLPMTVSRQQSDSAGLRFKDPRQTLRLVYAGNLGHHTDFELLIDVAKVQPHVSIIFAGSGPCRSLIRKAAEDNRNIEFLGWLEQEELACLYRDADFGVIAYKDIDNFTLNIPNKFAEYAAYGLPIVCLTPGEMARLTESFSAGVTLSSPSVEEVANLLGSVANDRTGLKAMALNASHMYDEVFQEKKVLESMAAQFKDCWAGV